MTRERFPRSTSDDVVASAAEPLPAPPARLTFADAIELVEQLGQVYRSGGDTPRATALEHAVRELRSRQ